MQGCRYPFAEAFVFEAEGERGQAVPALQQRELAELEGDEVERNDGEWIGVQGDEYRNRQVDPRQDGEYRRCRELHGVAARNQPREQARGDPAGDRAAVQVPQVGVLQPRPEPGDVAVLSDRLVVGEKSAEELAGHGSAGAQVCASRRFYINVHRMCASGVT